jgi:hypothetical protein
VVFKYFENRKTIKRRKKVGCWVPRNSALKIETVVSLTLYQVSEVKEKYVLILLMALLYM